jgi:hypothetical protein
MKISIKEHVYTRPDQPGLRGSQIPGFMHRGEFYHVDDLPGLAKTIADTYNAAHPDQPPLVVGSIEWVIERLPKPPKKPGMQVIGPKKDPPWFW